MSDSGTDPQNRSTSEWAPADPDVRRLLDRLTMFEAAVTDTLESLGNAVAGEVGGADDRADAPSAHRWAQQATVPGWDELVEWVDELNTSYSLISNYRVLSCWPAHPGVVEELAATHRAWKVAVIVDAAEGDNGSNEVAAWHDRWLWPMLRRLDKGHYTLSACHVAHVPERDAAQPTDRSHVPKHNGN